MSEFSNALQEAINHRFQGKPANLATESGIDRSVISRLTKGTLAPSLERLESLAQALPKEHRENTLLAAARDTIPPRYRADIFANQHRYNKPTPPDIRAILLYLEDESVHDETTRAYLRRLWSWIQPPAQQLSLVAEDNQPAEESNPDKNVTFKTNPKKS